MTSEVTNPVTPGETVLVRMAELVCSPVWVTSEAVVSGSEGERARGGVLVLVTAGELVANEVTAPGNSDETVDVETAELASSPGRVAVEGVLSDSLWVELRVVLGTAGLVSVEWRTTEPVVSALLGEAVRVGIAELASDPGWVTHEAVVSG